MSLNLSLGRLCAALLLPGLMAVSGFSFADAAACVAQCGVDQASCATQGRVGLVCSDAHRVCVERCDPQRVSKSSVLALYPPTGRQLSGPRSSLPLADQFALCRQDCAMQIYTCMGGQRSYSGGGDVSGLNSESGCHLAGRRCEANCPGADPLLQSRLAASPEPVRARQPQ